LRSFEITRNGTNVGVPRYYRKKLIYKDSVDEYNYHKHCENKRKEIEEPYLESDGYVNRFYYKDRASDQERRSKHLEASEKLFKKGNI
jgi:hypothetical protein